MFLSEKGGDTVRKEQRQTFLEQFALRYDLPGAAKKAGITHREAYRLLREEAGRRLVDERVTARRRGEVLSRIVREYENLAFGGEEDVRPGERIRALEQLRLIASAEGDGAAPTLTVRCEYV